MRVKLNTAQGIIDPLLLSGHHVETFQQRQSFCAVVQRALEPSLVDIVNAASVFNADRIKFELYGNLQPTIACCCLILR